MSTNTMVKDPKKSDEAPTHEWDVFPAEAPARSSIVTPVSDQRAASSATGNEAAAQKCHYCTETLPPGARECPLCLREVARAVPDTRTRLITPQAPTSQPSTGTSLAAASLAAAEPLMASTGASTAAVYTLESPARCPECDAEITAIHVIRVLRTQVSFTSTLPRKAYVIACPACNRLLSAGLSGLI